MWTFITVNLFSRRWSHIWPVPSISHKAHIAIGSSVILIVHRHPELQSVWFPFLGNLFICSYSQNQTFQGRVNNQEMKLHPLLVYFKEHLSEWRRSDYKEYQEMFKCANVIRKKNAFIYVNSLFFNFFNLTSRGTNSSRPLTSVYWNTDSLTSLI